MNKKEFVVPLREGDSILLVEESADYRVICEIPEGKRGLANIEIEECSIGECPECGGKLQRVPYKTVECEEENCDFHYDVDEPDDYHYRDTGINSISTTKEVSKEDG